MNKLLLLSYLATVTTVISQGEPPLPLQYKPLKMGTVFPQGWLYNELRLQGNGLSGKFHEFWEPIQSSQWLGGDSTFEDWFEIL